MMNTSGASLSPMDEQSDNIPFSICYHTLGMTASTGARFGCTENMTISDIIGEEAPGAFSLCTGDCIVSISRKGWTVFALMRKQQKPFVSLKEAKEDEEREFYLDYGGAKERQGFRVSTTISSLQRLTLPPILQTSHWSDATRDRTHILPIVKLDALPLRYLCTSNYPLTFSIIESSIYRFWWEPLHQQYQFYTYRIKILRPVPKNIFLIHNFFLLGLQQNCLLF